LFSIKKQYLTLGQTQVYPAFLFITKPKGSFMKKFIVVAVLLSLFGVAVPAQKKGTPKTQKEKVSYSLGQNIGKNMKMQGIDVDQDYLLQGMRDALSNAKSAMSEKDMETTMNAFQQEMMTKVQAKQKVDGEKNKKEGEAFLAANKKKDGVITLASGLQYKVLKMGTGPKPTSLQTVTCNYRGTLIDGKEFDASSRYGKPAEFPVGGVIKGWTEALQLMPVGSKWELYIPSDLAYGENGAGQTIGPNAVLVFEIELLSIK
jgi:FKBP-type peptidyl-prolyl cis-trans isomerase FklB